MSQAPSLETGHICMQTQTQKSTAISSWVEALKVKMDL